MKRTFFLIILSIVVSSQIRANHFSSEKKIYLLSFPRSGNTWMRYILESLTNRPSYVLKGIENSEIPINQPLVAKSSKRKGIIKAHDKTYFLKNDISSKQDWLIFLVRNPKECVVRNHLYSDKLFSFKFFAKKFYESSFYENILLYFSWPTNKRFLVYYEDLISNPKKTLLETLDFLEEDKSALVSFLKDFEFHKKNVLNLYGTISKSYTRGDKTDCHSYKVSILDRRYFDKVVSRDKKANEILNRYSEVK